jgi:hypothetical protein
LNNINDKNTAKLESAFKELEDDMGKLRSLSSSLSTQSNNTSSKDTDNNDDFWETTPQKKNSDEQAKQRSKQYSQKADEAVAKGDYTKAEEHLKEANRINPSQTTQQQLKQIEALKNEQSEYNKTMEINTMTMSSFDGTANGSLMTLAKGTGAMLATGELNAGVVAGGLGLILAGKSPERKAKEEKAAAEAAKAMAAKKEIERQETLSRNYLNAIKNLNL